MTPHTRQEMCPQGVPVDSDEHIALIVGPKVREIYGDSAELGHYKLAIAIYKMAMEAWHTLPSQAPAPQNNTLVCDDCGHEGCDCGPAEPKSKTGAIKE
jgi:hypothetical protein